MNAPRRIPANDDDLPLVAFIRRRSHVFDKSIVAIAITVWAIFAVQLVGAFVR